MPKPSVISLLIEKQNSCFSINYGYMLNVIILSQGSVKKPKILMKRLIWNNKISIASQQLEEFQWDFLERCELKSKVTQKQGFNLSQNLSKSIKIWSKKKAFEDFQVFDFGYRSKSKTRKPLKVSFFLLKAYLNL